QPLANHLREVARLAEELAREAWPNLAGDGEQLRREKEAFQLAARWAGFLHDLGKYRREFQLKLEFESRGERAPVPREATYHKQAEAAKALEAKHGPVAFAIAGHHGGLPNPNGPSGLDNLVADSSGRAAANTIWPTAVQDCPELASLSLRPPP